ncbi:MAG: hypothetical protein ACI9CF_000570 [Candidatus Omnitrophota bacterium]|jgi:hypothetical protein
MPKKKLSNSVYSSLKVGSNGFAKSSLGSQRTAKKKVVKTKSVAPKKKAPPKPKVKVVNRLKSIAPVATKNKTVKKTPARKKMLPKPILNYVLYSSNRIESELRAELKDIPMATNKRLDNDFGEDFDYLINDMDAFRSPILDHDIRYNLGMAAIEIATLAFAICFVLLNSL